MVERFPDKKEVDGSIPSQPTRTPNQNIFAQSDLVDVVHNKTDVDRKFTLSKIEGIPGSPTKSPFDKLKLPSL